MSDQSIEQLKAEIAALSKQTESIQQTSTSSQTGLGMYQSAYDDSVLLSCVVVGFGVFVLLCITYLLSKNKQPDVLLRPFGTILIIIASVFLIVAGYSEKQIAPVIGLLGTIAGYILGKETSKVADETQKGGEETPRNG